MRARSSGRPASRPPTTAVNAASPFHPLTSAPQSTETMSPASSTRDPGMPWTTSSLTLVHSVWLYPGTSWKFGMPPLLRMNSSARRSSSSVVMPGRTSAASSSRVRPTSRPASRMRRSCSSVRPWSRFRRPNIRGPSRVAALGQSRSAVLRQGRDDTVGDLVDGAHAVDLDEEPDELVVLREGCGLLAVDRLALADDVLGVVGATLGLGALEQALDDGVLVDLELEHGVERVPVTRQHRVERVDLTRGARVAVEEETALGVVPGEAVLDDLVGDVVGDVAAGLDDLVDLDPERGLVLDVGAEDVAGRDGRDAEALGDPCRLRALTGAGRPEDDQSH